MHGIVMLKSRDQHYRYRKNSLTFITTHLNRTPIICIIIGETRMKIIYLIMQKRIFLNLELVDLINFQLIVDLIKSIPVLEILHIQS